MTEKRPTQDHHREIAWIGLIYAGVLDYLDAEIKQAEDPEDEGITVDDWPDASEGELTEISTLKRIRAEIAARRDREIARGG